MAQRFGLAGLLTNCSSSLQFSDASYAVVMKQTTQSAPLTPSACNRARVTQCVASDMNARQFALLLPPPAPILCPLLSSLPLPPAATASCLTVAAYRATCQVTGWRVKNVPCCHRCSYPFRRPHPAHGWQRHGEKITSSSCKNDQSAPHHPDCAAELGQPLASLHHYRLHVPAIETNTHV